MKPSAIAVGALLFMGYAPITQSDNKVVAPDSEQTAVMCAGADPEIQMAIEVGENQMASICRADGLGDCLYTHAFGKTFVQARPDLNTDGRKDFLIKDFSGVYGMHDMVHFMGFVGCPGNFYVKVLDDFLTDVHVKDDASSRQWRQLRVSRACFDEDRGGIVTREYKITFDHARSGYGPPDASPALTEFSGADELALPAGMSEN